MKIVVITSSAHVNGASDYLADQFVKGAQTGGHEIYRYDAVDHQNNFVMVDEENAAITQMTLNNCCKRSRKPTWS